MPALMNVDRTVTGADMIGDSSASFGGQLDLKIMGMDCPGTVEHGQIRISS